MVQQLGFRLRGTTDAALVLTQAVNGGVSSTGAKWLWQLQPRLQASFAVELAAAVDAEAADLPDVLYQPASSAVDAEVGSLQHGLVLRPSHDVAHLQRMHCNACAARRDAQTCFCDCAAKASYHHPKLI